MSQSAIISQSEGFLDTMPLGAILAWHRDLDPATHLPTLRPGWVMCDGQVLDDTESPFNGLTVPNLNGDAGTNDGGLFLRGRTSSGVSQGHQMQSHGHAEASPGHYHAIGINAHGPPGAYGDYVNDFDNPNVANILTRSTNHVTVVVGNPSDSGSGAGAPHHGAETRPVNMSVIWIMKIKHVVTSRAVPAVQAAPSTPPGAIYIGESGNVGIGTATPNATLQVNGTFHSPGSIVQVVTLPITQQYGPGADDAWSANLVTLGVTPRFANSKIIVSCSGIINLADDGAGDPHLGAIVRIMAGGVRVASTRVFITNSTVPGVNMGFFLEGQHLPGATTPINYGIQLSQRTDTTATLFANDPEIGGPFLFKAMEIAQ